MESKLLFFCSDYKVGLTTALSEQVLELKKLSNIRLSCISSEKEMEHGLHDKLKEACIDMTVVPHLDVHSNFRGLVEAVDNVIKDKSITHVNVHNNWQLAIVAFIKYSRVIPRKFKIIYTIHGYRHNSFFKSCLAILVIGLALLLFADRVISMSSYVSKRFWFVSYKTDLVFYIMNKPEFNKLTNIIDPLPLRLVFPAQFRYGKNQQMLIRAVELYIRKTKDNTIKLYLPGDGVNLEECKSMVRSKGLCNNILFPGKLPHCKVIDLYEASNIALVASNVETYGRCIAEPVALGRCLITRKTGVALDIVKNGVNGLFFSTEVDLVNILEKLHQSPELLINIANNAFNDKYLFSANHVMNSYIAALGKA